MGNKKKNQSRASRHRRLATVSSLDEFRAKVVARDLRVGGVLDRGPILGFNQQLLAEPLGDGLLAECRTIQKLGDSPSELRLRTANGNRADKRLDVGFFHGGPDYTTMVVAVNKFGCSTDYNAGCTVSAMPQLRHKNQTPKRVRTAIVGADNKTLGARVRMAIKAKSQQLGAEYTPLQLRIDASRAIGMNPDKDEWVLTQQALSLILTDQTSETPAAIALAAALGVNPLWLQFGRGPASYIEQLIKTN